MEGHVAYVIVAVVFAFFVGATVVRGRYVREVERLMEKVEQERRHVVRLTNERDDARYRWHMAAADARKWRDLYMVSGATAPMEVAPKRKRTKKKDSGGDGVGLTMISVDEVVYEGFTAGGAGGDE